MNTKQKQTTKNQLFTPPPLAFCLNTKKLCPLKDNVIACKAILSYVNLFIIINLFLIMFLYPQKIFSQVKFTKAITFWSDDVSLVRYSDTSLMTNSSIMNSCIINYNFLKYDTINTHRALTNFPKYLFFIRLDTFVNADSVIDRISNFNVKYLSITDEQLITASCTTTYNDPAINNSCGDGISQNDKNWPLVKVQADCAHDITKGDDEVVAIIDIDFEDHSDIINKREFLKKYPLGNWATAEHDHGSSCASFGFAETNNNSGIASLGYNVNYGAYSMGENGGMEDCLAAIFDAIKVENIKIISISINLGIIDKNIIKALVAEYGVTFIYAAGNSKYKNGHLTNYDKWYADYSLIDGVIIVGATTENDNFAPGYTYYSGIDVSAPGYNIRTIDASYSNNVPILNCVWNRNGTSYSAPMVAALVALMRKANPNLKPNEIECIIKNTCDPIVAAPGFPIYPGEMGAGRINAFKAVDFVKNALPNITKSGLVTSTQTWTGDIYIPNDLTIIQNVELIILNANVIISPGKKIIVEDGAKLTVDNSTLGGNFGCVSNQPLWGGIIVKGMGSIKEQFGLLPTGGNGYLTGFVRIKNNSIIQYAYKGIEVGTNNFDAGGIIITSNSTFKNCRFGVMFHQYSSPTEPDKNYSFINETDFVWDVMIPGYDDFNTHIWMGDIKGVDIFGCFFKNLVPKSILGINYPLYYPKDPSKAGLPISRGRGVGAWNSGFNILRSDIFGTVTFPGCDIPDGRGCVFEGLEIGVHSVNPPIYSYTNPLNIAPKVLISESAFINNLFGSHVSEDYRTLVYHNSFTWNSLFQNIYRGNNTPQTVAITQLGSEAMKIADNKIIFDCDYDILYDYVGIYHNDIKGERNLTSGRTSYHLGTTVAKNEFISTSPDIRSIAHYIQGTWVPSIQCNSYNQDIKIGWYTDVHHPVYTQLKNGGGGYNASISNYWMQVDAANNWNNCNPGQYAINGTGSTEFAIEYYGQENNLPPSMCIANYDLTSLHNHWFSLPIPGVSPGKTNTFCTNPLFIPKSSIYCRGIDGYASTADDDDGNGGGGENPIGFVLPNQNTEINSMYDMNGEMIIDGVLIVDNYKKLYLQDDALKQHLIELAKADTKLPNQISAQLLIQFYNIIIPQNIRERASKENETAQLNEVNTLKTNLAIIPNPNKGTFSIRYKEKADFTICVINSVGIEVFKANVQSNTEISVPDHIAPGIYYVRVESINSPPVTQKISIIK